MTSEARHPSSPAPVVSVKARAQEIEARSGTGVKSQEHAGFSPTPVARVQEKIFSPKKNQATAAGVSSARSGDDLPSRRCSEGDIFQHCKVRQPPPTAPRPRRVSLENATLPAVPERRSTLGRLAESSESSCSREPPCQTKTTSKFTPFTAGGKGGVTNSQAATADFSPAIFSSNRLLAQTKQSPLDDIITALEKICDEFTLPEDSCRRFSADQHLETSSLPRGYDDVFEKCVRRTSTAQSNHNANDKSQWLSEHGVSQVEECQKIKPDAPGKSFEAKVLPDGSGSVKHSSPRRADSVGAESIVYRSGVVLSPKSNERHVVSATLFVSPLKVEAKCESGKSVYSSPSKFVSDAGKAEINTGTVAKGEKDHHVKTTSENVGVNSCSLKSNYVTSSLQSKLNQKHVTNASKIEVRNDKKDKQTTSPKHVSVKFGDHALKKDDDRNTKDELNKVKKPVACKPNIPKIFTNPLSLKENSLSRNDKYHGKNEDGYDNSPSEELEIVKNILANLDFEKYKRRSSLDEMESKSPKPPRAQKTSSAKFKDLFDLLKPSSETSSSSKRPFGLCRSSSFSNAETIASDKDPPNLFQQNEENDAITPLPEDSKRISTLPRRKPPSQLFSKITSTPAPVPAVASCPSIVKLENRVASNHDTDPSHDEGLVSDSEVGPGAYVTAYVSCVTSSPKQASGWRGHVRSASDNVTSGSSTVLPEVRIKKTSSTEKLWFSVTSRLNGPEKQRKRRKGVGCKQAMGEVDQEPVKSGRSLTYPPQRKSSTSEEEQEFTSVDSNGLKSLKHQTAGLMDSGSDAVRLLSDLSLADSHLCPSEGTIEETYLDVVDSVIHSPTDQQHLSVEESSGSTSSKSHKKKHHSDPGGEAGTNSSGDGFVAEVIVGLGRSEPDLGSNETGAANSSSSSSASSETSSRATQTPHFEDERPTPLKLVIDGPRNAQGTKNSRAVTGGSLTSGATTNSRFHFPETDPSNQRLAIEQNQCSKSPQEQRRYSKRRLRGPYGEMLEEEMRKSGEKQKSVLNDLSFLQDIVETGTKNQDASSASENLSQSQNRPAMFVSSQSLDDASSMSSRNELSMCVTPKRKISANYPLLTDGESVAIASDEDISPTKPPTPNEPIANNDILRNEINTDAKNECQQKNKDDKDDVKGLTDFNKIHERHSDTRTHVVAELYDTEKSYVESLQILANKYMKPLKSPECSGIVETSLVDEIFYQIPEILAHHESFLNLLKLRLNSWDTKQKVGDVFVEAFTKQQIIDTYTAFINNWKSAKDAIKLATQAKPAFARFLEHMSREHKGKLTLDALLIMPVQRIPRYELLIKELLKHTHVDHPDHHLLVLAQKEVHDLALKINRMEREAFALEQMQQRVRDIEQLVDGVMDLVQPDRDFIRHDMVSMPGGLGTKKERCLFLFSDVLLITSMKRKSATMRKPSATSSVSQNTISSLEMNKYKLLTKLSLDNLDIAKSTDGNLKKLLKDIENIEEDVALLSQISELVAKLNTHQQALEDVVKDLTNGMVKQLNEKQNFDSQLVSLELTITTQTREGVESLIFHFSSPEKRAIWEAAFNDAKQKLALSTDRRPPPEFMHPLPIRKTRAGLQFTCATATLGLNQQGLRDVWVCNSDGYVGQVCVLSLMPEPTVMSCNGVCNARIVTIASIPAASTTYSDKTRWRPDNVSGVSIEVQEVDEEYDEERASNGNIQLDSDSSDDDDDDDTESTDEEKGKDENRKRGNSIPKDECQDDMDNKQPTMWLGTEDGCIHIYNCHDNIRTKKNKIKIQHGASIICIIYLDNKVFVSIANGEIHVYKKDPDGGWCTSESQKIVLGNTMAPVTKMLAVAGKLWCGCQNIIHVLNTTNLQVEHSFAVSSDVTRTVLCMVTSGLGVWIALQHSAILRLFHATSYECLFDINVAPAVTKMLSGCDDIIRQHKAACLRITAVLACKDLLWVGTSAGVILTLPLPHLTSATISLDDIPNVSGLPYGHTGHVRFLTCVEMTPGTSLDLSGYNKYTVRSLRSKEGAGGRRASTSASTGCKLLVISGGDGYEDFQNSGLGEAAGRDDSTNHLLLWQV